MINLLLIVLITVVGLILAIQVIDRMLMGRWMVFINKLLLADFCYLMSGGSDEQHRLFMERLDSMVNARLKFLALPSRWLSKEEIHKLDLDDSTKLSERVAKVMKTLKEEDLVGYSMYSRMFAANLK